MASLPESTPQMELKGQHGPLEKPQPELQIEMEMQEYVNHLSNFLTYLIC